MFNITMHIYDNDNGFKESGKMCHREVSHRIIEHELSLGAYSNVINGMQLASIYNILYEKSWMAFAIF